jgi:hypothetical protein
MTRNANKRSRRAFGEMMKMVFTDPSVVPCDILKGLLEARGVPSIIKNERGSAGASVGDPVPFMVSATFAWPEVWVPDDRYDESSAIVKDMKQQEVTAGNPWKCSKCGEEVDPELTSCWNCDTPKDE